MRWTLGGIFELPTWFITEFWCRDQDNRLCTLLECKLLITIICCLCFELGMDREMSNPKKVPRKKQRPLSNTGMSEREKKLAVLLEKNRQMDLEIEALQRDRPETESDPGPSTVEESAEEVKDPANRDWRKIALALAAREKLAPVAVATIQLPSLEFSAGPRDNPVLFLERFESYYAQVREYRPDKLEEVISCLSREAEDFALAHRHILTDFSSFREEFLRFFWSKAKRTQLRKGLLAEQYDPTRGISMVQFFTRPYYRVKNPVVRPIEDAVSRAGGGRSDRRPEGCAPERCLDRNPDGRDQSPEDA
jgi:hypothetical protein